MKTYLPLIPACLLLGIAPVVQGAPSHRPPTAQASNFVQQEVRHIVDLSKSDSKKIPQLTAQVIVSNRETLNNAAEIAAGVVEATGVKGDLVAAAIAKEFANHPELVNQAPAIAAALVKSILAKGNTPQIGAEAANAVAALVALLPGTVQSQQATIVQIAEAVAPLVAGNPELAKMVFGEIATDLRVSSGTSDISPTLTSLAQILGNGDPSLTSSLNTMGKSIAAGQIYTALPTTPTIATDNKGVNTITQGGISTGNATPPETPTQQP